MKWTGFWNQFDAADHSNHKPNSSNKLAYLRDAIKDQSASQPLYSVNELSTHYGDVVELQKRRYDKMRIIHANYTRALADLPHIKSNYVEIRSMVDTMSSLLSGLEHTGQFDGPSIITSLCVAKLPQVLQKAWDLATCENPEVPPADKLIVFLEGRADALAGAKAMNPTAARMVPKYDKPKKIRATVHVTHFQDPETTAPCAKERSTVCMLAHPTNYCPLRQEAPCKGKQLVLQLLGLWTLHQRMQKPS